MKENRYDDESFFGRYGKMPRSVAGLAAAGEWYALRKMLPPFKGKRVLDLGCGFGWHCRYAAEQGAAHVVGIDLSEKMLAEAKERNASPFVEYTRMALEDMDFPDASFDVVLSSLALHYIADFKSVCAAVNRSLAPGGAFVFSVEHPVFTARAPQNWIRSDAGEALHWPVDGYFDEGLREMVFLGEDIVKYHRTVAGYVSPLLESGFTLTGLSEPPPDPELLETHPEYADESRRPMFLLISAGKP